jgi:HK97 gp10 family phage protein
MPDKTFQIVGYDALRARLKALPPKMRDKVMAGAVKAGATHVKKIAISKAKTFAREKDPIHIWQNIVIRSNKTLGAENGGIAYQVGVRGGAKRYTNNSKNRRRQRVGKTYEGPGNVYWWRFKEFGTVKQKAEPFMRPALADHISDTTEAIVARAKVLLDKLQV